MSDKNKAGIYLAWRTVTYRSVVLMIMAVLLVAVVVMHFALPQVTDAGVQQVSKLTDRLLEGIAG